MLGLTEVVHKHYYTAMVSAVAIACLVRGWRAGLAALGTGLLGVAMLIPPVFRMEIDSAGEVLILVVFFFTAGIICVIAFVNDRGRRELRIAESQRISTEKWLETAQQFTRFWTWDFDLDRQLVKWVNPYSELKSQVYEPIDSWMARMHPDDRITWLTALDQARFTNTLELQFRVPGPARDRYFVAKGMLMDDPVRIEKRLVGISVEMPSPRSESPMQDESQFALYGVEDLLDNLSENGNLDHRARRNVEMARQIVKRLLPQEKQAQRRAV